MNALTMCSTASCKIAMYHPSTSAVVILGVGEEAKLHGQSCRTLFIDDEYLVKTAGGLENPYHDELEFVKEDMPGLIDVSNSIGVPMYLSKPHFYSDGSGGVNLFERYGLVPISGMSFPSKELHDSSILVEIATGMPIQSNLRLQYNILLPPDSSTLNQFQGKNLGSGGDSVLLPLYWHDVESAITPEGGEFMNTHPIYALYWIEYTLLPLSIVVTLMCIVGGFLCVRRGNYIVANPSMRVNEAGMRYHQWMHHMHIAKIKMTQQQMKERDERTALENRIRRGLKKTESTAGVSRKKHHADKFEDTTSPFHQNL